jgi:predicted nucleic acid-binding protein
MSGKRATYLDSSALVKLAVAEPESTALRRYVERRQPLVSSALARTEVARALLPHGSEARRRGLEVLARVELIRLADRILEAAGLLLPAQLRSLDAIHLASAAELGADAGAFVTYDDRLAAAASEHGLRVVRPGARTGGRPAPGGSA